MKFIQWLFRRRNAGAARPSNTAAQEESNWQGGMSEEEFRLAVERADAMSPEGRLEVMSPQPTTVERRSEIMRSIVSGGGAQQVGSLIRDNPTLRSLGGGGRLGGVIQGLGMLAEGNQTFITGLRQYNSLLNGMTAEAMQRLEPEALRGFIFLRQVCAESGVTLQPCSKSKAFSAVVSIQQLYETAVSVSRSRSPSNGPPSYEQWLRTVVTNARGQGATAITVEDLMNSALKASLPTEIARIIL